MIHPIKDFRRDRWSTRQPRFLELCPRPLSDCARQKRQRAVLSERSRESARQGKGPPWQSAAASFSALSSSALELLAVDVDFLLDRLFRARKYLVEVFFKARFADHEQRCLARFDEVAQFLGVGT